MRDTDADWSEIAETDPYWGVLSVEEFRNANMSREGIAKFYESGEVLVRDLLAFAQTHLQKPIKFNRALDFGCGVGRLAIPLSRRFKDVVGLDIAPAMLQIAKDNAARFEASNVRFALSDESLSNADGEFDFVNSIIVLQHINPVRGLALIDGLIRKTAPGGIVSLQLTYARDRKFLVHEGPRAHYFRREEGAIVDLLVKSDPHQTGTVTMYDYDLNAVLCLAFQYLGTPLMVIPTNDDGHLGVHLVGIRAR